jgi:predicted molibdopterin-dependent oxidoreductase YjgC
LRGKGKLVSIDCEAGSEHVVDGFPYLLVTGPLLEQYNVGTMIRRTPNIDLVGSDLREMHPEDLLRKQIPQNASVRLAGRWDKIDVPVDASDRVAPGT